MFIYQGIAYESKKELREKTKLSGSKIKAKITDGEIKITNHTGSQSYEELHNNTKQFCNKA